MNSLLFRSAKPNDLSGIHQLAQICGPGMTTLPNHLMTLKKRLALSTQSFKKSIQQPINEYYLFVLEDLKSNLIIGTSAIEASLGHEVPFYSYKLSKRTRISHQLAIRSHYDILSLVNDHQGHSELCTLFLNPPFRKTGQGNFLSRARFLFMANFTERFAPIIIAEMRGLSDETGHSPFWNNIGQHFFKMSFTKADQLTISTNKQFIADLMPRNSIYVTLLSKEAQSAIGKPHPSTLPAMNILLREGFRYNHYIDIFDGGPTIEASRDHIQTITDSRIIKIKQFVDDLCGKRFMIANTKLDFRATLGEVIIDKGKKTGVIHHKTAELLKIKAGDLIRIAPC